MNPTTGIKNENVLLSIANGLLVEPLNNGSRGRHVDSLHHVEPKNDTSILGSVAIGTTKSMEGRVGMVCTICRAVVP